MPYIKTAYVGDKQENSLHFGIVTLRLRGRGVLNLKLATVDEEEIDQLSPIQIPDNVDTNSSTLAGLITQRANLEIRTNAKNDYFRITRITLWSTFFASEIPQ